MLTAEFSDGGKTLCSFTFQKSSVYPELFTASVAGDFNGIPQIVRNVRIPC